MSVPQLVQQLRAAAAAYYNGGESTLDDDTYDALVDRLRELDPKNPFLTEIGAPPAEGAVPLPYPMPSLDKIKPGQDALGRFLGLGHPLLLSEKLDGLSALWLPASRRLYLRGDGTVGQDISHLVRLGIQGLRPAQQSSLANPSLAGGPAIRGELVVPRATVQTLARSWVNGVIHQKVPVAADVARIRFVAYDLLEPKGLTRSQSFTLLTNQGYELPWFQSLPTATVDDLATALKARRTASAYDTDGIVVAYDREPVRPAAGKNPKDAVAFKMPLAEQSAITTLEEVLWKPSAQGFLIPTLRFQPIEIAGARIEFCTAHNARTVVERGLGPGATVRVRRSGDVIPTLDAVIAPAAAGASMPPAETWEWVSGDTHIRSITATDAQTVAQLQHFFKVLAVPSMGPSNCEALVKAGLKGPAAIAAATVERLGEVVGPKTGAALYANLRTAVAKASESTLMIASSTLPRGVGETKLKALFEACPDSTQWAQLRPPAGWTDTTFQTFLSALPTYRAWHTTEMAWNAMNAKTTVVVPPKTKGTICFTGFREKDLETKAVAAGYSIAPAFSSKVAILVVPDPPKEAGAEKLAKARSTGATILTRTEFLSNL